MSLNKSKHPAYRVWDGMIQRCTNPNAANYERYGGRGITVCKEWRSSSTFLKWADENGFEKGLQLERVDNNLGYSPENCKWVKLEEQYLNKRNSILIEYDGITDTLSGWSRRLDLNLNTMYLRYRKGKSVEEIFKEKYK